MRHFQHVILGTGQATGTLLGHLLTTGDSIAVIEGDRVGGTCVNTGCTPTKALVASARVAHMVRRAPEYGVQPSGLEIDFTTVRARMNAIRDNTGMETWLSSAEIVIVHCRQVIRYERISVNHLYRRCRDLCVIGYSSGDQLPAPEQNRRPDALTSSAESVTDRFFQHT